MPVDKIVTPKHGQEILFELITKDFPEQYSVSRPMAYDPFFEEECNLAVSQVVRTDDLSVLTMMSTGAWRVFFERAVQFMMMLLKAEGIGKKSIATVPFSASDADLKIFLVAAWLLPSELPIPPGDLPANENLLIPRG